MKGRLSGTSSLMVIGLLLAPAGAGAAEIGAVIQEEYSGATGVRVDGVQEELRFQHPVHADEKVLTTADAVTQLQFLDDSTLYVGTNSVVVLDKFVYDPASQLGEAAISFTKGAFRFVSGEMKNEEAISLKTPKAALVIRGTTVTVYLLDDGSEVLDIDGAATVRACGAPPSNVVSGGAILIDYMCDTTLGYASGPESGPPVFEGFTPAGGGGGTSGQENTQRGAAAGDPPAHTHSPSVPPTDSVGDGGYGDGEGGSGDGDGDGGS